MNKLKRQWWQGIMILILLFVGIPNANGQDENKDVNILDKHGYMNVTYEPGFARFVMKYELAHTRGDYDFQRASHITYLGIKINGTTYFEIRNVTPLHSYPLLSQSREFSITNVFGNNIAYGKGFTTGHDHTWCDWTKKETTDFSAPGSNNGWRGETHWYVPQSLLGTDVKIEYDYGYNYPFNVGVVSMLYDTKDWTLKATSPIQPILLDGQPVVDYGNNQLKVKWKIPGFVATTAGHGKIRVEKKIRNGYWTLLKEDASYSNTKADGIVDIPLNLVSVDELNEGFQVRVIRSRAPWAHDMIYTTTSEWSNPIQVFTFKNFTTQNNTNGTITLKWGLRSKPTYSGSFAIERATNDSFTSNFKEVGTVTFNNNGALSYSFDDTSIDRGKGGVMYYYRIKPKALGKWEFKFMISNSLWVNTDYFTPSNFKIKVIADTTVNLSWETTSNGIWEDGFKYRISLTTEGVTSTKTTLVNKTDKTCTVEGLINCKPLVFNVEVINSASEAINKHSYAPVVVSDATIIPSLSSISVSKGIYSNYVSVEWKAKEKHLDNFIRYLIHRREMSEDVSANDSKLPVQVAVIDHQLGISSYRYEDDKIQPGTYYEYTVSGQSTCNNIISTVASGVLSSVGFMQPYGVVNGRISFQDGTTSVQNVEILVEGTDKMKNKSLLFDKKVKNHISIPYKVNTLSATEFTLQSWIRLRDNTSAAQGLLSSEGKYSISITNNKLAMDIYFLNGKKTTLAFDTEITNLDAYRHITVSYQANKTLETVTAKLYVDGELVETLLPNYTPWKTNGIGFIDTSLSKEIWIGRTLVGDEFFDGYMDELRVWRKVLSDEDIKYNCHRYLSGKEDGLAAYYQFDELFGGDVYDISGNASQYNENHGKISGVAMRSSIEIPSANQLSIKGVTDKNGQFLINTIPYLSDGSSYTLTPVLGVHAFSPSQKTLYFNKSIFTINDVNFTDISSFKVEGKVYYEGGTYPVEGCSFYVDGKTLLKKDGSPITTDATGKYTIHVPIGQHELKVAKTGHTFVNGGLALKGGDNIVFNDSITGLNFQDNTRVKLIGRVVGGKQENEKVLGFGEAINNIGATTLKLTASKAGYMLSTANSGVESTILHNNGEWKKKDGLEQDSTKMTVLANDITITVSPHTGEFMAWVYPEFYEIDAVNIHPNKNLLINKEVLDLTNSAVDRKDLMQKNIRTWVDSVTIKGTGNQQDYKVGVEHSDTIYYNKEWKHFYQATPKFSVKQMLGKNTVDYFGDKTYKKENPITGKIEDITLFTKDDVTDAIDYTFSIPVFIQGNTYDFKFKAYEEYINAAKGDKVDIVKVNTGIVKISNDLELERTDPMQLDSIGEAVYKFYVGAPDLTSGIKGFFMALELDNITYNWDYGNTSQVAFLLGAKSTGTDFITAGPDEITAVLHDPPGSLSYSYLEKGATFTNTTSLSVTGGIELEASAEIDLGAKLTTFIGLGAGVILDTEIIASTEVGLTTSTSFKSGNETQTVTTITERFETSSDPLYVGHMGDVFIGNSTNIQYGETNSITILHKDEIDGVTNMKVDNSPDGEYVIAKSKGLAFGQTFGTRFVFAEVELENIMIPKWKNTLSTLLKSYKPEVGAITKPFYYSKLATNDANFGKLNTDQKTFGTQASKSDKYSDGPSYEIIFPAGYLQSDAMNTFVDSVMYFNNQITRWEKVLADNEEQKVKMKNIGNYSFGSGGKIEYSSSSSETKTTSFEHALVISPKFGIKTGVEICGMGMVVSASSTISAGVENSSSTGVEKAKTVGFVLEEEGGDDQISVDYGWTQGGMIAFKSRGGRTSCPYEGEVRSKYYEPGKHVLSEGGMQIEVPVLTVKGGNYALKVPSNRPASFILELKNESQADEDAWFNLLVDETTNPYGAELKIDGIGIGNGRKFLVKAGEILEKTLTITKGPSEDKYENVKFLLVSQCQYDPTNFLEDIYDDIHVSVEFLPSCSDIAIKLPNDKWTVNTQTGDSIDIVLHGYDVNFSKFGYIELQYKRAALAQWTSLMKFYTDQTKYDEAEGVKTLIGQNDTDINYRWVMSQLENGAYDLRARTVCESGGVVISECITPLVSGIKDMVRPTLFGKAQPSDGILRGTNDIMIQFNKDINDGLITENNVTITGIKNGAVDNHFTSIHFDGVKSEVSMDQEINLGGRSFAIEFWMKRDKLGESTIFSHGQNGGEFAIGFNSNNNLQISIGKDHIVTSSITSTNTSEWGHWAVAYDAVSSAVTAYYAAGSTNEVVIDNKRLAPYNGMGIVNLGASRTKTNYFAGNIHNLRIWDKAISLSKITGNRNKVLSGNEIGLIGYWPMNEGKGNLALDKAANRHAVLNTSWKILPEGKALNFNGVDASMSINTSSSVAIDQEKDFTIEMWFKGNQANSALFSCGRGDGLDFNTANKMSIFFDNKVLKFASKGKVQTLSNIDYLDNKWHHVAISVRRTGSANMYIDGNQVNYIDGMEVGSLASDQMTIGMRRWTEDSFEYKTDMPFKGEIDEVRIWDMALNQNFITNHHNVRLTGSETGLIAYYPFDTYIVNSNDKKELAFSLKDQVKGSIVADAVANKATTTAEIAPIKDAGAVGAYAFTVVTNKDRLVLNLNEANDIIEQTQITITVKDIYDLNGNKMASPFSWHAFIDRSFLKWEESVISKAKKNGAPLSFDVNIVNTGGSEEEYVINNIPSWLEVADSQGRVKPSSTKMLKFTVNEGLNPGIYEQILYLDGEYVNSLILKLNVGGEKPDWTVDPNKYETSMSVIGQLKISDIISKDENDLVAAFINGECVGVASPKYNKGYDVWQVMLNVYYSSINNPIEFRIWDASTGRTYANVLPTNITFKANTLQGSVINPIMFETTNALLQIVDLKTGWNWISFNSQTPALQDINRLFYGISNGMEVKGQQAGIFSRYDVAHNVWLNGEMSGNGLTNSQMYQVKMSGANTLSISGIPLDPAQTSIVLKLGWNWISYIPQANMTVSEAFSGLTPSEGDLVKSILGFAVYDTKLGWVGSLEYMAPNQGYMYKAAKEGMFKYPSHSSLARMSSKAAISNTEVVFKYENNLSLIGEVDLGITIPNSAQLIAKVNGEIRGRASIINVEDKQLFFTSVQADSPKDIVSFSLLSNNEEVKLSERITFNKNEVIGSIEKPMQFTTNDKNTFVYPNPFVDHLSIEIASEEPAVAKVMMYNLTGSLIFSSDYKVNAGNNQIEINENVLISLAQGVYFLRVELDGKVESFKLIKQP